MSAYADLIAASPAAGTSRATPLGDLLWETARAVIAARKDLNEKLAWITRDVAALAQGQGDGSLPCDGNFGTRGAEVDIAIVKLQAAENTFSALAGTIGEMQQARA